MTSQGNFASWVSRHFRYSSVFIVLFFRLVRPIAINLEGLYLKRCFYIIWKCNLITLLKNTFVLCFLNFWKLCSSVLLITLLMKVSLSPFYKWGDWGNDAVVHSGTSGVIKSSALSIHLSSWSCTPLPQFRMLPEPHGG